VAFVIGAHAQGHEDALRRWLEAGFALGNHSHGHRAASAAGAAAFIDDVDRCDDILQELGAFEDDRRRYLRLPFGDRGATPTDRQAIADALSRRGYAVAEVTVDFYDHCFETPMAQALRAGDGARAEAIAARFLTVALGSLSRIQRRAARAWPAPHAHVAALHFGPTCERTLPALLQALAGRARLCPLAEAVATPGHRAGLADVQRQGILGDALPRPLAERALRRLARPARRLGLLRQHELGPRFPHLAP
jgi:hypothetical protein